MSSGCEKNDKGGESKVRKEWLWETVNYSCSLRDVIFRMCGNVCYGISDV